jgi:hypothetical protein
VKRKLKNPVDPYSAIRTDVVVVGRRDVVVVRAPISTAQATVITPRLAEHVGIDVSGPVRCTESALGRFCGRVQPVQVAIDECRTVSVNAIVAPIAQEVGKLIVGTNVLRRAKPLFSFAPGRPMSVTCRVPSRRKSLDLGWLW